MIDDKNLIIFRRAMRVVIAYFYYKSKAILWSFLKKTPPPTLPENVDIDEVKEKMRRYWLDELKVTSKTCDSWLSDAFDYPHYQFVVDLAKEVFGTLKDKKILDLGCGWGTLSLLLSREGADVIFIDRTAVHVEVTEERLLNSGEGYMCDARELKVLSDKSIEIAFLHSLIEHVGDFNEYRGDATHSYEDKLKVMKEVYRTLNNGGKAFISTGNYNFPLDGEIKTWFFHWLPKTYQNEILDSMEIKADNYGILKWDELEGLCLESGFVIDKVVTADTQYFKRVLEILSALFTLIGTRLPPILVDRLAYLMQNDPRFMPAWYVFLTKP